MQQEKLYKHKGKSSRDEWWDEECRKIIQEKNDARKK
jgi:hypothetical protein